MGSLGQENDAVGYLAFGPSDTDVLDRSATFIKVEIAPPKVTDPLGRIYPYCRSSYERPLHNSSVYEYS